jgi:putative inorganic carbon (hco3(-)) transporter
LILLAIVTSSIITTEARMRFAVLAWLAGSAVSVMAAILAIALFYLGAGDWLLGILTSHSGAVPVGNFPRVSSTFVSPSMFCNFLTVGLVVAFAAKRIGWIGRVPASILISGIAIAAIFTFSISLGGFFLAVGIWLWFDTREKGTAGRIGFGICLLAALASLLVAPFALPADLWSTAGSFTIPAVPESSRVLVWREAINTFLAHPATGRGIGTAAANVHYQNYDGSTSLLVDAHNTFLSLAAQAGIVGLAAIVILVGTVLKTGFSDRSESKWGILRFAFVIAFSAAFVFDGLTGSFEDTRHLWVLIGLIIAARKIEPVSDENL